MFAKLTIRQASDFEVLSPTPELSNITLGAHIINLVLLRWLCSLLCRVGRQPPVSECQPRRPFGEDVLLCKDFRASHRDTSCRLYARLEGDEVAGTLSDSGRSRPWEDDVVPGRCPHARESRLLCAMVRKPGCCSSVTRDIVSRPASLSACNES